MKKIIVLIISLFLFLSPLYAVSSDSVRYDVEDYIVDAKMDITGNLKIKEIIKIDGTFNGYIRDLQYQNSLLNEFTGADSDFEGSAIYNASGLADIKVGSINWEGDLNFDAFDSEVTYFTSESCYSGIKACYEESEITDGISLKMFNETYKSSTYFYIEYTLANVVVLHNDVAELYYNFIGYGFDDEIERYQLRLLLPYSTNGDVRVWAHGPLTGEIELIGEEKEEGKIYSGALLKINNLDRNTPVDLRMTFPKKLISLKFEGVTKETNIDALEKILAVEEKRANEANRLRERSRKLTTLTYFLSGTYLILLVLIIIYVYLKYDKEVKTEFTNQYNREFIDDYDVTVIEYLFSKNITSKAFSTSILNLIYKKNISVEKLSEKKENYKFTKLNDENTTLAERNLMTMIFSEIGDEKTVTLNQIKDYAKKINGTTSPFLNSFNEWKFLVKDDAIKQNFYENNGKIKGICFLYCILGVICLFLHYKLGMFNIFTLLIVVLTIIFIIYIASFTKRTKNGALHYAKWKAFKRFLEDFGRFDEKELPEIVLWERYLVYANIFGIADKVGKTMKIKFKEINSDATTNNGDLVFNYLLYNNLNQSINSTVTSSISTANSKVSEAIAKSTYSSGGGYGGGFSSGGGFGGGGGGGRGF